ncbi:MAG: RimK family alpha-L-glutamate ligase [Anaerolineaceae bacterium]|nr:RimK family alpha-L-glutamate ligase [Anaerolineaceae bacterium]
MIQVALMGSQESWHSQVLVEAFRKHGITPVIVEAARSKAMLGVNRQVASGEQVLSTFDLLLVREVPGGSLEQVIFRMDALHQLENCGVRVVNSPYAIEKMVDKYYTLSLLQDTGLRVPETLVTENDADALEGFHTLGGDVVVKPLFGSRGVGMVRVSDADTAGRVFKALHLGGYVYYLQKYIPHNNSDLRVLVVGQECIAGMGRISEHWKTNIAAGGRPVALELTEEMIEMSRNAARVVGADYCGVDLMNNEAGELFVIEVNSMPAWRALQEVTPIDIAGRIVEHCLKLIAAPPTR